MAFLFAASTVTANHDEEIQFENQISVREMPITPTDCWELAAAIADNLYDGDYDVFEDRYETCMTLVE